MNQRQCLLSSTARHPHDLVCGHYRTGFQNGILASASESEAIEKVIRRHDCCAYNNPLAGFLQFTGMTIMAGMSLSLKQKKLQKTLVKNFLQFLAE